MRGRYDVEVCDYCGETVGEKHAIRRAAECRHPNTRTHIEALAVAFMALGAIVAVIVAYAIGHATRPHAANVPVLRCESGVFVARTDRGETARCAVTSR